MPTKKKQKMTPARAHEVRERFARACDELGSLDTSAVASGEPMPSAKAVTQARRMIGALGGADSARRLHRLASLLDELIALDADAQSSGTTEAA